MIIPRLFESNKFTLNLFHSSSVMVTGSEDRTARIWSSKTDRCECIGILTGHEDYINAIAIDESFVITGSADKTVRKWDLCSCDCVQVFKGHNSLINRLICTGDFMFTSSYDRTARCWDFDSGECIRVFSGHKRGVYPLIFIPEEGDELIENSVAWEGNKDILITGSADFSARSWSLETGKTLQIFKGHEGAVTCMATNPRGTVLFTGSTDHFIRSWDIRKGDGLKVFEGHTGSLLCMTVSIKLIVYLAYLHVISEFQVNTRYQYADSTRISICNTDLISSCHYIGIIITACQIDVKLLLSIVPHHIVT